MEYWNIGMKGLKRMTFFEYLNFSLILTNNDSKKLTTAAGPLREPPNRPGGSIRPANGILAACAGLIPTPEKATPTHFRAIETID